MVLLTLFFLPGNSGERREITPADTVQLALSEGPSRLTGGEVGLVAYFGQYWFLDDSFVAYAPYRQPGAKNQPARLFVMLRAESREKLVEAAQRPAWTGILVEGGLPGTIRTLFRGYDIPVGQQYFTLYPDRKAIQARYWVQAGQLLLVALALLLFGLFQRRRARRLQREYKGDAPIPA
jgi:hypothetical protein